VVITGGADDCQAQAAETIKAEAARAGITLEQFVVGFQLSATDSAAVKGMVAASSSGGTSTATYVDAPDVDTLRNILTAIQAHVDQPTVIPATIVQQAATPGAVLNIPTASPHTAVPQATSGAGGATSVPSNGFTGQTACDHPYFPIRPGATWTYSGTSGAQTWTVASVTGDQTSAVAVVQITVQDATITYNWLCDAQGIRFYQGVGYTGSGGSGTMTIANEKGVTIPGPTLLVPGATWEHSYDMSLDIQGTTATNSISQTLTAGEVSSVTNNLGTFDTITITGSSTMTLSVLNQTFNSTQSFVLGKGVGILQESSESSGGSDSVSLTSYHIP
jgi:hypothetical protein